MMKGGLSCCRHLIIVKKGSNSSSARKSHQSGPFFQDILPVFEALRKDSYWADHNGEVNKANVKCSNAKLMNLSKKYIPTSEGTASSYPKFHEFMHIVDDMSRFGAPQSFCAQQPELLLILAANHPDRRAQKCHKGVVYEFQAAQRLCYSFMINTVLDCIQNGTPAPPPKNQVNTFLN